MRMYSLFMFMALQGYTQRQHHADAVSHAASAQRLQADHIPTAAGCPAGACASDLI